MTSIKNQLQKNGIIRIENVFSTEEITDIRKNLQDYFENQWIEADCGKVQINAAVNCDFLEDVFTHPNIISAMQAVADDKPLFTGNADIHQNKLGNWHKDTNFFGCDPFSESCKPLYKIAIYLQDQRSDLTGIQYREGSHHIVNHLDGRHAAMTTSAGDVVIFDLRMTHSGMLPTFPEKIVRNISRLLSIVKKQHSFGRRVKSLIWKARQMENRESIFFVFGSDNEITEEFAANIVKAQSSRPGHKAKISPQLSKKLQDKGVKVCRSINPFCQTK